MLECPMVQRFQILFALTWALAGTHGLAARQQESTQIPTQERATERAEKEASEVFPNAHLLVTTEWLAQHGADENLIVVDVRRADDYANAHLPGAIHVPTSATFDPQRRGDIGSAQHLARLLGANGIARSSRVVLYDEGRSTSAARFLWTLEVYGHPSVAVVDGGFAKWKAEQRELSGQEVKRDVVTYEAPEERARISTKGDVLDDVGVGEAVMLDSRSEREFAAGRIPAAVHIDWNRNFTDDEVPVWLSPVELRKLYVDQGVTPDKRVHAY